VRTTADLMPTISGERRAFGDVLEGLTESDWNAPSLCEGWRVREMVRSRGNFARMADRVARRDARAPIGTLLDGWRTGENHPWKPPGGGLKGALTHDVVHGLDITIPLGIEHPVSEQALRVVLDHATTPLSLKHSGLDVTGIRFEADDLDWAFGDGKPLRSRARYLLMVLMDRRLPAELLCGPATARFTTG
jgi:hypothetical protein